MACIKYIKMGYNAAKDGEEIKITIEEDGE